MVQLFQYHKDLHACLDHVTIDLGGVNFESLPQTIAWVKANHPSGSFYVFMNLNTLLHALGSSHLSDKNFDDERCHATRGCFEN